MMSNEDFLLRRDYIRDDARLKVVDELAAKAHFGEFRKNGSPAIDHPRLVCNLVNWFGEKLWLDTTPAQLRLQKAVALLHDTLEDCPRYKVTEEELAALKAAVPHDEYVHAKHILVKEHQELLKGDLIAALKTKLSTPEKPLSDSDNKELEHWADQVFHGVKALTHGPYKESKRFSKVDEAHKLPPLWAPIKSLDQAASIVDDIVHVNIEGMSDIPPSKLQDYKNGIVSTVSELPIVKILHDLKTNMDVSLKSRDVSVNLPYISSHNDPYHTFLQSCYDTYKAIYDLAYDNGKFIEAAPKQKAFNIVEKLEEAYSISLLPTERVELPSVVHYKRSLPLDPKRGGITEIIVHEEKDPKLPHHKVAGYFMWATDDAPTVKKRPAHAILPEGPHKKKYKVPMRRTPLNANDCSESMQHALEEITDIKVGTHRRVDSERYYSLDESTIDMDLARFLTIARQEGAVDSAYLRKITIQQKKEQQQKAVASNRKVSATASPFYSHGDASGMMEVAQFVDQLNKETHTPETSGKIKS